MRIAVFGAGAWGTALALAFSRGHEIVLWSRESDEISAMRADGENRRYLPGIPLPEAIRVHAGQATAAELQQHDLVIVATPTAALRAFHFLD